MEAAFGGSDAAAAWNWKTAYDACEVAIVLFLRRYSRVPTQTRHSEDSRPISSSPHRSRSASPQRQRRRSRQPCRPAPVPGALDQIIQHFGTDIVIEATRRSRCILRKPGNGAESFAVTDRQVIIPTRAPGRRPAC